MGSSLSSAVIERTRLPRYLQAAALIRQRIEKGEWKVGERLPSIEELARQMPMARLTIRQGLACLEQEGVVECRQGSGTYVARDPSAQRWYRVATDWNSLINEIAEGTQQTLKVATPPPFPDVPPSEGRLAAAYRYLKRVNLKDGVPYGFMSYHIDAAVFERDPCGFLSAPVLPTLAKLPEVRIRSARQTMHVATADLEASTLLKIPLEFPVVLARRVIVDDQGVAIFVSHITYRGDYVHFEVDLMPTKQSAPRIGHGKKSR